MLWFGVDCVYGLAVPLLRKWLLQWILKMKGPLSSAFDRDPGNDDGYPHFHKKYLKRTRRYIAIVHCIVLFFCGPSVWGFITVVKMLYDWGVCIHLAYP
ncbi:hypothetical protein BJX66DRAFT_31142 [Aspergillus keveii]|uniref:Uncharacterized protein n=1 Tax=Aspergillus keveii TaxID=714993 RepID=A0ABR4FU29_9EURO